MTLPQVAQGNPHVKAHNDERDVINAIDERNNHIGSVQNRFSTAPITLVHATNVNYLCNVFYMPPSKKWQKLDYGFVLGMGGTGGAVVYANLYDIFVSPVSAVDFAHARIAPADPTTTIGNKLVGRYDVPPHDDWKVFVVTGYLSKDIIGDTRSVYINHFNSTYGSKMFGATL